MDYLKVYLNMNKDVKIKSKNKVKVIYRLVNQFDGKRRRGLKQSCSGGTFLEF